MYRVVAAIESRLQFPRGNFGHLHIRSGGFFPTHAAKLVIVDELIDGALLAAIGQFGFCAALVAEFHPQGIEKQHRPTRLSPRPMISLMVSIA